MNVLTSCLVLLVGLLANIQADQGKESVQIIDHPHKNEYTSMVAGSDKHKYGYELKENKHFHHTTTEEDGVRLGCYGYLLDGKKYSTQYVADVKGYRPVSTHDLITVYPKSGGERQASFVGDFNEDKARSENIRYFFPDGCKGIEVKIPIAAMPPPLRSVITVSNPPNLIPAGSANPPASIITQNTVKKPSTSIFEPPFLPVQSKPIALITTTKATSKPTSAPPKLTPAVTPSASTPKPTPPVTNSPATLPATSSKSAVTTPKPVPVVTNPPTTKAPVTTPKPVPVVTNPPTSQVSATTPKPVPVVTNPPTPKAPASTTQIVVNTPRPTPPLLTKIPVPFNSLLRNPVPEKVGKSGGSCSCCEDDDSAKLILPIAMKHLGGQAEGTCGAYAKLIIPVEGLNPDSLRSLTRGPDATSELLKSVLQSLS